MVQIMARYVNYKDINLLWKVHLFISLLVDEKGFRQVFEICDCNELVKFPFPYHMMLIWHDKPLHIDLFIHQV